MRIVCLLAFSSEHLNSKPPVLVVFSLLPPVVIQRGATAPIHVVERRSTSRMVMNASSRTCCFRILEPFKAALRTYCLGTGGARLPATVQFPGIIWHHTVLQVGQASLT